MNHVSLTRQGDAFLILASTLVWYTTESWGFMHDWLIDWLCFSSRLEIFLTKDVIIAGAELQPLLSILAPTVTSFETIKRGCHTTWSIYIVVFKGHVYSCLSAIIVNFRKLSITRQPSIDSYGTLWYRSRNRSMKTEGLRWRHDSKRESSTSVLRNVNHTSSLATDIIWRHFLKRKTHESVRFHLRFGKNAIKRIIKLCLLQEITGNKLG